MSKEIVITVLNLTALNGQNVEQENCDEYC